MDITEVNVSAGTNFSDALSTRVNITDDLDALVMEDEGSAHHYMFGGELRISMYSLIFLLSLTGNTLVIVTLVQNRQMRTVLNVFLLNLSISDLLLAVFCMPFTLIPTLLRDFIFGKVMCHVIRYIQGKSCATLSGLYKVSHV